MLQYREKASIGRVIKCQKLKANLSAGNADMKVSDGWGNVPDAAVGTAWKKN